MNPNNRDADFEGRLRLLRSELSTDPGMALSHAQDLLANWGDARVVSVIAEAQRRLGNVRDAEIADLLALKVSGRDPALGQAAEANRQGRWDEAAGIAKAYLASSEGNLLALTIHAEAMLGLRRAIAAEDSARQVLERVPSVVRARLALSRSLMLQCRLGEAIDLLDNWLEGHPNSPEVLELLAAELETAARFDRAVEARQRLLSIESDNPRAWLDYAQTLRFAGREADARKALERCLAIDPLDGSAWWTLANMAPDAVTAADMALMEGALERSRDAENSSHLHVALATILDRSGDYEQAFQHFSKGKALRSRNLKDEFDHFVRDNDRTIQVFDDLFPKRMDEGAGESAPIFIIGIPRSGSTLVERALGRHPQIEAAGELPIIPGLIDELDAEAGGRGRYRDLLAGLSGARLEELGNRYIRRSEEFKSSGKPYFTDKLHMNWRHLGLIRLILPKAKIIDVRRSPIDCCWSNYKVLFASGHPASNDLATIGHFYREYVRMTEHARPWTRGHMLPVSYEAAVEDLEAEVRRILSFLDLDFEPGCLDFHRLETPVATMSAEQVRKPLNREGIGRWKPYRQWLGPLFEALGPLAADD